MNPLVVVTVSGALMAQTDDAAREQEKSREELFAEAECKLAHQMILYATSYEDCYYEFREAVSHALTSETPALCRMSGCAYRPAIRRFLLFGSRLRGTAAYRVKLSACFTNNLCSTLPVGWWRKPKPAPLNFTPCLTPKTSNFSPP